MRGRFNRGDSSLEWFFEKVFPKLFIGMFILGAVVIVVQFAVVGYAGYKLVTDPTGAANFVGTIAGEVMRPVADAVRGE